MSIQESVESEEVDICVVVGELARLAGSSVRGESAGSGLIMFVVDVAADDVNTLRARLRVTSGDSTGIRERRGGSLQVCGSQVTKSTWRRVTAFFGKR